MDHAVALVEAYLQINGYFTVAEYPVIESSTHAGHRVPDGIRFQRRSPATRWLQYSDAGTYHQLH